MSGEWVVTELADDATETDEGNTWKSIGTLLDAYSKDMAQLKAAEWSRLANIQPDGETLHWFGRKPSQEWNHIPYDANVLVEWATAVVLARDNPGLLGPLH